MRRGRRFIDVGVERAPRATAQNQLNSGLLPMLLPEIPSKGQRPSIHAIELVGESMRRERRSPLSAERRRTHAPPARSVSANPGRLGRRIAPAWLTVSQLCRRWQVDRQTIYKFIHAKILPVWKVSDHLYRVEVDDVLRFEARNKFPALQSAGRVSLPPKD